MTQVFLHSISRFWEAIAKVALGLGSWADEIDDTSASGECMSNNHVTLSDTL